MILNKIKKHFAGAVDRKTALFFYSRCSMYGSLLNPFVPFCEVAVAADVQIDYNKEN